MAILLLALLSVPATLAQAGSSSESGNRVAKLAAKIRNLGKSSPKKDILVDLLSKVMPTETYKELEPYWKTAVKNQWIDANTGLATKTDIFRGEEEEKHVAYIMAVMGRYADQVKP